MTQDEIIRMAREASNTPIDHHATPDLFGVRQIERFAALVAAHEREAVIDLVAMYGGSVDLEAAIRARNSTNKCQFDTELVAIEAAVLAEREACAKVCEAIDAEAFGVLPARAVIISNHCAAAIRAR